VLLQHGQTGLDVVNLDHDHGLVGLVFERGVEIFDADAFVAEERHDARQFTGMIGHFDADDVGFARRKTSVFEQLHGFIRLVGDHAQDAEIGRVGDGDGAQIDAGLGQQRGHVGEPTGLRLRPEPRFRRGAWRRGR